jgi:hypothetical protein
MTTKNGAAAESYSGADETVGAPRRPDNSYPWADSTSKLKDITIDPDDSVTRAIDKAAACERRAKLSRPDTIVLFASIYLLHRGVGKATCTLQDLAQIEDIDLIGNVPPRGASEHSRRLIRDHYDILISFIMDGWHHGRELLCNYARYLMEKGEPLPERLAEFLIWGTRDGAKARRQGCRRTVRAYDNVDRDQIIANAVRRIVDITGCRASRNAAPKKNGRNESGCSIVANALGLVGVNMSELGVEKIWFETKGATVNLLDRPLKRRIQRDYRSRRCA